MRGIIGGHRAHMKQQGRGICASPIDIARGHPDRKQRDAQDVYRKEQRVVEDCTFFFVCRSINLSNEDVCENTLRIQHVDAI